MKEKYEIEIHDMTAKGIYVYIHESTSFYNAFLTAKAIQRVYENSWRRKTEIKKIEKKTMKMSEKYKKLNREITIAVLSAILTWLGVSCTNMLSIQKNVKGSSMSTDNKTDGKVSADSTSINLFNKEDKK